ncbi:MAG TPA: efflux RND transporter periplasmic adaptor subunit [Blastocatellia bacterium]|nr:efflux RND transporter periplasmic adaptor subunit [Blastocatellia bacterium]
MKRVLTHKLVIAAGIAILIIAGFLVLGWSRGKTSAPPPSLVEVEVAQVDQKDVPIYSDWIGSLDGMVNAEIKSQVTGYLLTKDYTEGSFVKKGQLLFEIDPRPFQAALDQAKGDLAKAKGQLAQSNSQLLQARAQLASAQANKGKTQLDVDRYVPLAAANAITQQEIDNAVQANIAAKAQVDAANAGVETAKAAIVAATAQVQAAEAQVKTAELNVGFTRITSPIDGIAGIATVQVGNLVTLNNPNSPPLTTVSTVDPIRAYFTVGEQEYLNQIQGKLINAAHGSAEKPLELELVLSDGTTYPQKGKFYVADRNVDQKTGAIKLAGVFPNPGNVLRPGQYGRVRALTSMHEGALLVPQRAVTELQGSYRVAVVGDDHKVSIRPVKPGEKVGDMWIIEDGLKRGELVIAEGTQKVRPGAEVTTKPFASSANEKTSP